MRGHVAFCVTSGPPTACSPYSRTRPHVVLDRTDGALHVRVRGTAISFYSARDGVDAPNLNGSETKKRVVGEMQLVMPGMRPDAPPVRLVLVHEADDDGTLRIAVGVLESPRIWAWQATLFDRFTAQIPEAATDQPGYDKQQEAELPPIHRRDEDEIGDTGTQ